jgi:hypothetical protein
MHETICPILLDWRLMLRRRIAIDLYPAVVPIAVSVVMFLVHTNLTHHGIMHIKKAVVSLQQHLEGCFPSRMQ